MMDVSDSHRQEPPNAFLLAAEELTTLSEERLQTDFIEPLFRALGYMNVRPTSGSVEKGKDIIANKIDEFGHLTLTAIQVKRLKLSGKADSPHSLGHLLNQLVQASEEPVIDPATNGRRIPDRTIFMGLSGFPNKTRGSSGVCRG